MYYGKLLCRYRILYINLVVISWKGKSTKLHCNVRSEMHGYHKTFLTNVTYFRPECYK